MLCSCKTSYIHGTEDVVLPYVVEYAKGAKLHRVSAEASLLPFIRGKVPILLASKVGRITHNHLVEK